MPLPGSVRIPPWWVRILPGWVRIPPWWVRTLVRTTPQLPYNALRGAPVSSAASLAAVDGGRCSLSVA
jgi:hypothetical protein